jgi:hypothetical protein
VLSAASGSKRARLARGLACAASLALGLLLAPAARAGDVRRDSIFIRPLLMGDAYVAVGDEASTLFYNPAGLARVTGNSVEAFTPQFIFNDLAKDIITKPDVVAQRYQNLSPSQFQSLLGTTLFFDVNLRMPVVVRESGWAVGTTVEALANIQVLHNPILPGLHIELFTDDTAFFSIAGHWGDALAVGITPKVVTRVGLDRTFTFGELFASGSSLDLQNQPDFKRVSKQTTYTSGGVDLGTILELPFWENGHPRVGFAALNIGGYDTHVGFKGIQFGNRPTPFDPPIGGELPQLNTVGFALSPVYTGIRYTFAVDVVDVTQTVLPGNDLALRTRVGLEIGIGLHKDGTPLFSLLAGSNANHPSAGVLARVWIFECGFGHYIVEQGPRPGVNPDGRTVFIFGFRI